MIEFFFFSNFFKFFFPENMRYAVVTASQWSTGRCSCWFWSNVNQEKVKGEQLVLMARGGGGKAQNKQGQTPTDLGD